MRTAVEDRSREGPQEVRHLLLMVVGAILLRLALLLGRGDYVAFDEGWYLLLGRNLWGGDGYTLSGLQHVTLSPLFPLLAGGLTGIIRDPVWAGRMVAAVSSGLLVVPSWYVFRRLGGRSAALVGALFVSLLPSLAPFVVPYWIGWDLWVGAEPLLHLFLFTGIALFLMAWTREADGMRRLAAAGCGVAFALAYLARPEAIVVVGLLGVGAVIGSLRTFPTKIGRVILCGVAFVVVAGPYWIYLHDSLGRWTITGRGIQMAPQAAIAPRSAEANVGASRIESMLWEGDASAYIQRLYALDATGTSLAADYWGIRPTDGTRGAPRDETGATVLPTTPDLGINSPASRAAPENQTGEAQPVAPPLRDGFLAQSQTQSEATSSSALRYAEALGVVVPWYLWIFVIAGLATPGNMLGGSRRLDLELLVGLPLATTSVLIARVVAIDPRTQLFIAPLAAFYAARGVLVVGSVIKNRLGEQVRGELPTRLLVGALVIVLLSTSIVRLAMSLTVGSPHHVVAAQNAEVGEAIREATPADATVMSFHPALALFADRDWRVLPVEPLDRIIRYARTQPNPHLVLSVFYPPELRPAEEPHYLIVPVPEELPEAERWRIDIPERRTIYSFGDLVPLE